MFLDEQLENIYNTVDDPQERAKQLANLCIDNIPKPEDMENMSWDEVLQTIKKINNSWCLFCKKHQDIKADWFKNFMKEVAPKELIASLAWN